MSDINTKLVVIGAGPGGYAAAFHAADLGIETTLIDIEENPGGVCLYRGCIPSKALLHAAKLIGDAKEAKEIGLEFGEPKIDIDRLREWKSGVIQKLTSGLASLAKSRKVNYIQGRAKFVDNKTLEIEASKGVTQTLTFEHAVLATGSRAAVIPSLPTDSKHIWNSRLALDIPEVPKKLLVIGGGYIGLEMGSVYAALGSKVTVVEMLDSLLAGADADLAKVLSKKLESAFQAIHLKTKVAAVEDNKEDCTVTFEGAHMGQEKFDKVLVAVGRKPNTENIGLENTKIKIGSDGFVMVDLQRRTHEQNIFAIGDVAGQPMLAHKATAEGKVAVQVIAGKKSAFEPRAIPAVVFTDPEVAWAGLTESDAKRENRDVKIVKFPWAASGRALTLNRTDGLTKLICDANEERILGVGIVGAHAGDLIAEGVHAIEMGATAEDLALSIHPHPTLSETIMEAADMVFGQSVHYFVKKKIDGCA